jgi:hypothetical protein
MNPKDLIVEHFVVCEYKVLSMTASNGRLTVTTLIDSLSVFDVVNGELLFQPTIDIQGKLLDAVESENKTFFALVEEPREDDDDEEDDEEEEDEEFVDRRVIELNSSGHMIKSFFVGTSTDSSWFSPPRLCLVGGGRLLVSDEDKRVLLLNRDFKSTRTLINFEQFDDFTFDRRWPFLLDYKKETNQLIVGQRCRDFYKDVVHIFEWK